MPARTVSVQSVVFWRHDGLPTFFGHSIGPPVGDEQQDGDHQQGDEHEPVLVPTALMCEDHRDDRTVWGTSRGHQPFYSAKGRETEPGAP